MARSTIKMVTESVDAYVKHDTALADQVIAEDDTVDDYFARVKKDSSSASRRTLMMVNSHSTC